LAIGGIIGLLAFDGKIIPFFKGMKRWQLLVFYVLSFLFLVYEGHYLNGILFTFERIIPGFIFAFVILEQIYAERSFFKADAIPLFAYSGRITYGFYMFHCISIYYWSIFFRDLGWTNGVEDYLLFFGCIFITTYTLAHFSFKYYETPILKLKRFFR
jgi:peptidoglycan/LPS O-acetylase OafA/YrhL